MALLPRDQILEATDLAKLADELLGPRRGRGPSATWPCPSPHHGPQTGRTPPVSIFTSDRGHQRWHCHACGAGGTAIDLLLETTGVPVRQALEQAGLLDPDPSQQVDQILQILQSTGPPLYDDFYLPFGGNNSNAMELPAGSGNLFIRPATLQTYDLINLDAAINSILGVPEPTSLLLLALSAPALLLRRQARMGRNLRSTVRKGRENANTSG